MANTLVKQGSHMFTVLHTVLWHEKCCQASPPGLGLTDDGLMSCQICGTFTLSCQPLAPTSWSLPSLVHPRLYGATNGPGGYRMLSGGTARPTLVWLVRESASMFKGLYAKQYRAHPLGWVLANLGCGQSHVGQQPVSVCMRVRVSSSICMNGLQYGIVAITIRIRRTYTQMIDLMIMSLPLPLPGSRIYSTGP